MQVKTKRVLVLTVLILVLFSTTAFASQNDVLISSTTESNILNKGDINSPVTKSIHIMDLKYKNKKLEIPDREELKKILLDKFLQKADEYRHNIDNIDAVVDSAYNYLLSISKQNDVSTMDFSTMDFRLYPHTHYWDPAPYVVKTEEYVAYTTSWIGIDCYRSPVGGTKTTSESKSVSYTLGFSGDIEILKEMGFSASRTYTHTITISEGTSCPAWTVVYWRPYVRYYKEYWRGWYVTEYWGVVNGSLQYITQYSVKTGTNNVLRYTSTEFKSYVNSAKDPLAPTPKPPTSAPIVY